jgi:hypothetical protein
MDKKYKADQKHQKAMEMYAKTRVNYFGLGNKRD